MTVRELREKMEGVPDYYTVAVYAEIDMLEEVGDRLTPKDVEARTSDLVLTIVI